MKLSIIPTLKCSALFAAAGLFLGCKAESTIAGQELVPTSPVVTNAPTNSTNEAVTITNIPAAKPPVAAPKVGEGVQQVINLAERGVGDDVLVAYIDQAPSPFNLNAEDILYLSDLGISEAVITAMIKHRSASTKTADKPAAATANAVAAPKPTEPINPALSTVPAMSQVLIAAQAPSVAIAATPEFEAGVQPPPVTYPTQPLQPEYNYFYSSLAPYGSWVEVPGYGLCWQPTVSVINPGWRPYNDRGRWIYSDWGWYWQSDYSWGWAPFHYGRWHSRGHLGWVWRPDRVWGPAWVTWRYSDAYCGWAPLPPGAYYDEHIGLSFGNSHVGISFDFGLGVDCFTFVPTHRFHDRTPWRHAVPRTRVGAIYSNTTVINNYVQINKTIVNEGISRERIAARSGSEIRKVTIRDGSHEVGRKTTIKADRLEKNGSELVVYRPQIPRAVSSVSHPREQQELRKPAPPSGRDNASARPGARRNTAPEASGTPRYSGRSEAAAKTPTQTALPGAATASATAPQAATVRPRFSPSEASARSSAAPPPVFRAPSQTLDVKSPGSVTTPPAKNAVGSRGNSETVLRSPQVTPNSRPNSSVGTASPPAKSANEGRSPIATRPQLIQTPLSPRPEREFPRPINSAPAVTQNAGGGFSPAQPESTQPYSLSSRTAPQPSYAAPSTTYPQQRPNSISAPPWTSRQTPHTEPQPAFQPNPASNYRQELQKPPTVAYPDRPTFGQPIPSYQQRPASSSMSSPSFSGPPAQSAPQYSPPARYSAPSSPNISIPSSRSQSSPAPSQPSQVAPSAPRSAPSGNSQPSSSGGSSRRNENTR